MGGGGGEEKKREKYEDKVKKYFSPPPNCCTKGEIHILKGHAGPPTKAKKKEAKRYSKGKGQPPIITST